jgi:hypothetical protein
MKLKPLLLTALLSIPVLPTPLPAALPGLKVLKLYSSGQTSYFRRQFGAAVAISDKYAVVGEPAYDTNTPGSGRVHVFNPVTGALIRILKSPNSKLNDGFGSSLALRGNLLAVGADERSTGGGQAFLFDLSTGKVLEKFNNSGVGTRFGQAVALTQDFMFVSSPGSNGGKGGLSVNSISATGGGIGFSYTGAAGAAFGTTMATSGDLLYIGVPGEATVRVYKNADFVLSLQPAGISVGDGFGNAFAAYGSDLIASAPLDNANGDTQSGSVHRFSAPFTSSSLIPVDPSPNSNRKSGEVMAREGALLVSTIARTGGGHDLILHNLTNNTPLLTIPSEELSLFKKVTSLGLASGRLLVGIPSDATLTTDAGAVFLIQTLPQPETFSTHLSKGDSAPGYPGISFNAIGDACLTPNGAAITRSTLSGPGSNRGKDTGLYSNVGHPGWFDSLVKSRDSYDSYLFGTIQNAPIANDPTFCLFQSTLTTPGVASANNRVLMRDNGSSTIDLMNTGSPIIGVPGVLKQIRQVSQSHSAAQFAINLNSRSSTPGLTLPNDSSILIRSNTGNPPTEIIAEGQTVPMQSFKIGELSPRTSFHSDCLHFSAALTEDVTTLNNTAVFSKKPGSPLTILARKGDPTPDLAATYSTFLAEGGTLARPFLRATVKGSGISTSNDDCLFFHNGAQLKLVARERQNAFVFGKNITWLRFRPGSASAMSGPLATASSSTPPLHPAPNSAPPMTPSSSTRKIKPGPNSPPKAPPSLAQRASSSPPSNASKSAPPAATTPSSPPSPAPPPPPTKSSSVATSTPAPPPSAPASCAALPLSSKKAPPSPPPTSVPPASPASPPPTSPPPIPPASVAKASPASSPPTAPPSSAPPSATAPPASSPSPNPDRQIARRWAA